MSNVTPTLERPVETSEVEDIPELPDSFFENGEVGKYYELYQHYKHARQLDTDLLELFPDNESVNTALREYLALKAK